MAKLTGVKTIDMVNGEITKVSYNGEEYTKVENGDVGDIAVIVDGWGSQSDGEFYVVTDITSSFGNTYAHIVGEHRGANGNVERMHYFRKISAQASPTIADISTKLDSIDTRLTALEKAYKPTEAESPYEFKVGDRVEITNHFDSRYKDLENGEIGKITQVGAFTDTPIRVETDGDYDYLPASALRLVSDEEVAKERKDSIFTQAGRNPNEYRKGDIVVVTDNHCAGGVSVGDIVEVGDAHADGSIFDAKHGYILGVSPVTFVESRLDHN